MEQSDIDWMLKEMEQLHTQGLPMGIYEYILDVIDRGIHELTYSTSEAANWKNYELTLLHEQNFPETAKEYIRQLLEREIINFRERKK